MTRNCSIISMNSVHEIHKAFIQFCNYYLGRYLSVLYSAQSVTVLVTYYFPIAKCS